MASLELYRAKRNFSRTGEPKGAAARNKAASRGGAFVIHKHAARRLHYDLRLEHDGVLWSWAVTRGPSLDPDDKRLAVHVEDHPIEYGAFEGTIPEGQYGAGSVIIWDEGQWLPEGDPALGMSKGHLAFTLEGHKLAGQWHLVRLKPRRGEKRDNWLLIKVRDEFARDDEDILEIAPLSVKSGRSIEEIGADGTKLWPTTKRPGAGTRKVADTKRRTVKGTAEADAALPSFVAPCLATLQDKPPVGENWLHEVKFDGYRLQARIDAGKVRLSTRSGLDWTGRFGAALVDALAKLPCETALIDGEVVALGEAGISSFSALQEALAEGRTGALVFFAFDLLHLDGEDLRAEPLLARKEQLEALLQAAAPDGPLRYSEHFVEPGQTMLRHACRMGLEGVVSKRVDAPYRSGRGRDWIKSKCTQRQEFVIAGYVPSKGSGRELGSLVLGYHADGALQPAGRVGTGFTRRSAAALKRKLDGIRTEDPPFAGTAGRDREVIWVEPELVAEIEFRAWTASKTLRHASFLGLREDKPATEVVAETPVSPKATSKAPVSKAAASKAKAVSAKPIAAKPGAAPVRARTEVRLSNPDKPLWPDIGLTKQGLLDYYATVWPLMRPFVIDRPLSLLRAPNGIAGPAFFQKHAGPGLNKAVATRKDTDGEELLYIRDFDGLAALVQLGTVEIHVWGAMIDTIETPDQVIFDLDPDEGVPLERVREAALSIRERLGELGFTSFLKTSGGKGFHVVIPLKPKADWTQVKGFARDFAKAMEQADPKRYTATLSKKARKGRIFIDYLRNARGATAIAPYSTRARPGAPVAMPIGWEALASSEPNGARAADIAAEQALSDTAWSGFWQPARGLKRA
ncbi:DNA ligase D [Bosea psychrotolerans]|uniref:DNA ligase (ATP) n=1 Tax=Bosea psychrotolerans TaxID=1871628 RepID=A0A2S4MCP5_9HYPH|nr:DNA ligase D [Bosea psychrotolerans]POR52484.1 ATP-dependent DNA ligase LigD phosphoesterase module /ATP-dependent DNA ligase LigD polymerase module [Bosea psychrotolerans]